VVALGAFRAEQLGGDPSDRAWARAARVSPDTIGHWLDRFPQDEGKFLVVVAIVLPQRSEVAEQLPDMPAIGSRT
jgi:hypothetical protein